MNIQSQESPWEIYSMGEKASAVLSNVKQGCVLARVSHAVYLLNEEDEVCWITGPDAPMHWRGMKTSAQLPALRAGSLYQVVDHTLVFNTNEIYTFHQAQIWKEARVPNKEVMPMPGLRGLIHSTTVRLLSKQRPEGLGCLIEPILQVTSGHQNALAARLENKFAKKAWLEVKGLMRSLHAKDNEGFREHAKALAGLGEGLTPSGDDFLGGFLFASRQMRKNYTEVMELPISNYADFMLDLKPLTNQISHTILMDYAGGHPPEPLQQLADSILMGKAKDELIRCAERLISLGHSTGWDILAGWIAGITVAIIQ